MIHDMIRYNIIYVHDSTTYTLIVSYNIIAP